MKKIFIAILSLLLFSTVSAKTMYYSVDVPADSVGNTTGDYAFARYFVNSLSMFQDSCETDDTLIFMTDYDNVMDDAGVTVAIESNVVIDLNGHTLSMDSSEDYFMTFTKEVTVKNGSVVTYSGIAPFGVIGARKLVRFSDLSITEKQSSCFYSTEIIEDGSFVNCIFSAANTGAGIELVKGCDGLTITDCSFNTGKYGVETESDTTVVCTNSTFSTTTGYYASTTLQSFTFSGCSFSGTTGISAKNMKVLGSIASCSFSSDANCIVTSTMCDNLTVENSIFTDGTDVIAIAAGNNLHVEDCTFSGFTTQAIKGNSTCTTWTISGNTITGGTHGVSLGTAAGGSEFTDCIFSNNSTAGILISAGSGTTITSGCTFTGATAQLKVVNGCTGAHTVHENTFSMPDEICIFAEGKGFDIHDNTFGEVDIDAPTYIQFGRSAGTDTETNWASAVHDNAFNPTAYNDTLTIKSFYMIVCRAKNIDIYNNTVTDGGFVPQSADRQFDFVRTYGANDIRVYNNDIAGAYLRPICLAVQGAYAPDSTLFVNNKIYSTCAAAAALSNDSLGVAKYFNFDHNYLGVTNGQNSGTLASITLSALAGYGDENYTMPESWRVNWGGIATGNGTDLVGVTTSEQGFSNVGVQSSTPNDPFIKQSNGEGLRDPIEALETLRAFGMTGVTLGVDNPIGVELWLHQYHANHDSTYARAAKDTLRLKGIPE